MTAETVNLNASRNHLVVPDNALRQRDIGASQLSEVMPAAQAYQVEIVRLTDRLADADAWIFRLAGERRLAQDTAAHALRKLAQTERALHHARTAWRPDPRFQTEMKRWETMTDELESQLIRANEALDTARDDTATLENRLAARFAEIATLTNLLSGHHALPAAGASHPDAERKLEERTNEIVTLSSLLREREKTGEAAKNNETWLRDVHRDMMAQPKWWRFMPRGWQARKQAARLKHKGLFDAETYMDRYPDVAQSGMAPLRHYILHGQAEGRFR